MPSKLRKNLKLKSISPTLVDAEYISSFFGFSLNALYLRMHFDNFPKATKINGKLYFDINDVIEHCKKDDETEAYCFLVRDEIRTFIDTGKLSRKQIGELLNASNPAVCGGLVYLRNISASRADELKNKLYKIGHRLDMDDKISFSDQKRERLQYIYEVWDTVLKLLDVNKFSKHAVGGFVTTKNLGFVGKSIIENGPSYKIAKIIKLKLLQSGLL